MQTSYIHQLYQNKLLLMDTNDIETSIKNRHFIREKYFLEITSGSGKKIECSFSSIKYDPFNATLRLCIGGMEHPIDKVERDGVVCTWSDVFQFFAGSRTVQISSIQGGVHGRPPVRASPTGIWRALNFAEIECKNL